jgi:hypothetical protein
MNFSKMKITPSDVVVVKSICQEYNCHLDTVAQKNTPVISCVAGCMITCKSSYKNDDGYNRFHMSPYQNYPRHVPPAPSYMPLQQAPAQCFSPPTTRVATKFILRISQNTKFDEIYFYFAKFRC